MDIGIIGGGAIGLLFGSYLATTHDVTIYTKTSKQAVILNLNGITIFNHSKTTEVNRRVNSSPISANIAEHDLVIVAIKQYGLVELTEILKNLNTQTLLFVQNGMGHLELLRDLSKKSTVLIGIVEHGALKELDNTVIHTGVGVTKLSAFHGDVEDTFLLFDSLPVANFKVTKEEDWYKSMTSKLVVNAVINPLTALYKIENGVLLQRDSFLETMKLLFEEVVSVIPVKDKLKQWNLVLEVCEKTVKNRSSMLKDLETGRQTENDAILGYIVEQARRKKIAVPITMFLYKSIRGLEEH